MRHIPENSQMAAQDHPRSGSPAHGGLVSRERVMAFQGKSVIRMLEEGFR